MAGKKETSSFQVYFMVDLSVKDSQVTPPLSWVWEMWVKDEDKKQLGAHCDAPADAPPLPSPPW